MESIQETQNYNSYPRILLFTNFSHYTRIHSSSPAQTKETDTLAFKRSQLCSKAFSCLVCFPRKFFCFLCTFTGLSIYMLLVFEIETGIASVCVLSSGILVLLVLVAHTLVRVACTSRHFYNQHVNTVYQNDPEISAGISTVASELSIREKTTRQRSEDGMNHLFTNTEPKQQYSSEREAYGVSGRIHRTLSTESSLLQTHTKPWKGVNNEMRTVLTRKATGKDSTLV